MSDSNIDWYIGGFTLGLAQAQWTPSSEQMEFDLWSVKNRYAGVVARAKGILAAAGLPTNVLAFAWKDCDERWREDLPPEGQRATCVYYLARERDPRSRQSQAAKILYYYEQMIKSYERGDRSEATWLASRLGTVSAEMRLGNLAVHGEKFNPGNGGRTGHYGPPKRLLLRICQELNRKPSFNEVLEDLENPTLADSLLEDDADPVTCVDVDFKARKVEYNYRGRRKSVTFDRLENILKYEI